MKESPNKWEATTFLDEKIQYCEDVTSPQIKCQIQRNSNQNLYEIVLELNRLILKFIWKNKYVKMAKKC